MKKAGWCIFPITGGGLCNTKIWARTGFSVSMETKLYECVYVTAINLFTTEFGQK